jgi:hypothetical protein
MAEIIPTIWNFTMYYQLDGVGTMYLTYGLADRARRMKR